MDDPILLTRRTAEALAAGTTADVLRGPSWTRSGHGVVRPADAPTSELLEHVAHAVAVAGRHGVVGGWAALALLGCAWFDGHTAEGLRPVLVHCPPGTQVRRRSGIEPFRGTLLPDEVLHLESYRVTSPARAAFDEMRTARDVRDAVVALDMAVSATSRLPHTTLRRVRAVVAAHHKVHGLVQARRALELGSERSCSPWETRTRLVAELDADLGRLEVNVPVFDLGGTLLGVVDLLDRRRGLVVEVDGDHHREREQHAEDNRREERLEQAGLVVVRVSSLDHRDRSALVRRLRRAASHAARTGPGTWTTLQPAWWHEWPGAHRWGSGSR
ncbi:endonuclease domain-containing protein [Aeromicrobium massiliense]|uniref:endonuclease domain-containing protein n=1 Tax=Aeromicrobium massiliense TaxID=1464554 RepID=UPI00057856ED|nr:DUF559 domain-containing protein [Aeromicrobium massiliense]